MSISAFRAGNVYFCGAHDGTYPQSFTSAFKRQLRKPVQYYAALVCRPRDFPIYLKVLLPLILKAQRYPVSCQGLCVLQFLKSLIVGKKKLIDPFYKLSLGNFFVPALLPSLPPGHKQPVEEPLNLKNNPL